jgi:TolB protein
MPLPKMISTPFRLLAAFVFLSAFSAARAEGNLGLFTDHGDVGTVSKPGTVTFDATANTYTVGASGANMWANTDAMQFVWKKKSGDFSVAADIAFVGTSTQPHRKACLVIRQNLNPGSAYVDVAQHGSGLTSIQFRDAEDGVTKEIECMTDGPSRVRLDRIGDDIYLSVGYAGGKPAPSGASFRLHLTDPVYVGLAVSAHDDNAFETAVFSHVEIGSASTDAAVAQPGLTIITLPSGDRRVAKVGDEAQGPPAH